jgi:hypothetical protein
VAVIVLLVRFTNNRWLWLALPLTGWHAIEHAFIMSEYLSTGIAGMPGLLSQGGALFGGLPLIRPDLHFIYNLVETVPLALGFGAQVRHSAVRHARAPIHRPKQARFAQMDDPVTFV